jgi:hypothetical protein
MAEDIKSGQQILNEFFASMADDKTLDPNVVKSLGELHEKGTFTNANVSNALLKLREAALIESPKEDKVK